MSDATERERRFVAELAHAASRAMLGIVKEAEINPDLYADCLVRANALLLGQIVALFPPPHQPELAAHIEQQFIPMFHTALDSMNTIVAPRRSWEDWE